MLFETTFKRLGVKSIPSLIPMVVDVRNQDHGFSQPGKLLVHVYDELPQHGAKRA